MKILIVGLLNRQEKLFRDKFEKAFPQTTFVFAPKDQRYKIPVVDAVVCSRFINHAEWLRIREKVGDAPIVHNRGSVSSMIESIKKISFLENAKGA